ncbi:DUF4159 domain-containing protein [Pseudohongiella nitratireducens]|uniref:DUF4159 domain-containing protein n=1 Tax=Pseudohongiella nitratireducens TaxID=1768907 RepID=UPI0030EF5673
MSRVERQQVWQAGVLTALICCSPMLHAQSQDPLQSSREALSFPRDFDITRIMSDEEESVSRRPGLGEQPEFVWQRGRYENYPAGRGRRGGWWDTDYPDAEQNFLRGVQRYSLVDTATDATRAIDLTDPALFEQIFLYMTMKRVPIGSIRSGPNFTEAELQALREFMLRGGFVLLDDFWGEAHLQDFQMEMARLFPEREVVELGVNHEIFHTFYDITVFPQVPGRAVTWNYGQFNLDDPQFPPAVYAILDDEGRVMLVANLNSDMGDGWEHTFHEYYPTFYSNEAYRLGINYLIYAFTH